MNPYILSTERFNLREFNENDASNLFKLNLHPDILKYTTDPPFKNIEEARQFINNYDAYQKSGFGRWAIEEKNTKAFIGWAGLKFVLSENEVDVGYRLLPEYWGKGIAVETGNACCEYGTIKFGLKRIVVRTHKENIRSIRVAEKMNIVFEKELIIDGIPWLKYVFNPSGKPIEKSSLVNFN